MAIDYPQLIADKRTDGSIKNWANNDVLPSSTIAFEAQQILYSRLRCQEMMTVLEATLGAAVDVLDLSVVAPNYRQPFLFQFTGTGKAWVDKKLPAEVEWAVNYDGNGVRITGKPTMFYTRGMKLQFEKVTDQSYAYRFLHYAALNPLNGTTNKSNFLTTRCFRAFKAVCMTLISEWLKKDADKVYWAKMATVEIDTVNVEADAEQYTGVDLNEEAV